VDEAGDREPLEDDPAETGGRADAVRCGADALAAGAVEGGAALADSMGGSAGGAGSGWLDAAEGGSDDADPEVETAVATLWADFAHPAMQTSRRNETARCDLRDSIYKCLFRIRF
jgi:hypothetical protein